jgi:predicted ATP-binding protein involved in virulence
LIRKEKNNFNFDPSGIVIIDEPETHLHLEMQYEILPILTSFFPNVQFVVASHSPAVISSLKNVMIFDLSSKQTGSKDMVSSSFAEIMTTHLGLDNQFSNVADEILKNIDDAFNAKDTFTLKQLLIDNEQYLSISLRLEIESRINHLKSLTEEE